MPFDPTVAAGEEMVVICSDEIDDRIDISAETIDGYDTRRPDYALEAMDDSRHAYFMEVYGGD